MNNFLMEEFSIASMEGKALQKNTVLLNFNIKTNIGLDMGGQVNLSIKTHIILMHFYNMI